VISTNVWVYILALVSTIGVELSPGTGFFTLDKEYAKAGPNYEVSYDRPLPLDDCKEHPDYYLNFPVVYDGLQRVYADDLLIQKSGGEDIDHLDTIVSQPVLKCSELIGHKVIKWVVQAHTLELAKIQYAPFVSSYRPKTAEVSRVIYILGAGASLMLALISLFRIYGGL